MEAEQDPRGLMPGDQKQVVTRNRKGRVLLTGRGLLTESDDILDCDGGDAASQARIESCLACTLC